MTSLQRPADEWANLLTHAVGWLVSLFAAVALLQRVTHDTLAVRVACGIYAATLVGMYTCSCLSHLFHQERLRRRFRTWDQISIFLLIAGTYTPIGTVYLSEGSWWWLMVAMWLIAAVGIARVWQVGDLSARDKFAYGVMGALPTIALGEVWGRMLPLQLVGIVGGGVAFLVGTLFLSQSARFRYAHAAWHALVLLGSGLHYLAIWLAVARR